MWEGACLYLGSVAGIIKRRSGVGRGAFFKNIYRGVRYGGKLRAKNSP